MTMDELIEQIGNVLPASGYREIAERVTVRMGETVSVQQVGAAIVRLRRDPDRFAWTIPHCKRGPDSPERLELLLFQPGSDYFVADDQRRAAMRDGGIGTWGHIASLAENLVMACKAARAYERSPSRRREWGSLIVDAEHLAQKARMTSDALVEERDAGT